MDNQSETICILDDDASVLKAMCRLLRSAGLQALTFSEARAFLQHAESNAIALAIIDIWMPEVNGLEVQRALLDIAPSIPVIMMTGRDAPAMRSVALAQGVAAFFAKPFADEARWTDGRGSSGAGRAPGQMVVRNCGRSSGREA